MGARHRLLPERRLADGRNPRPRLIAIANALAAAEDASSLAGIKVPADMRTVLEEAAPVYRKVWWERHSRSNRARTEELQALLARYGRVPTRPPGASS
jgi:hypothetical protein